MNLRKFLFLLPAICMVPAFAQTAKKKIDHTVYDGWKLTKGSQISSDGKVVTVEVNPQLGDGQLFIFLPEQQTSDSIARAYEAHIINGGNQVVFKIKAPYESIRKAKLAKKKEDDMPKDSLGVYDVSSRKIIAKYPVIKSVGTKEEIKWFAVHHGKMKDILPLKKKKKNAPEIKSDGTQLELISTDLFSIPADPKKKKKKGPVLSYVFPHVTEYSISKKGEQIAFVQQRNVNKTDSAYVFVFDPSANAYRCVYSAKGWCKSLRFDEQGKQLAFLASSDTAKNKVYDLWYWNTSNNSSSLLVDAGNASMTKDWCVSEYSSIYFSDNSSRLFFGTAPKPEKELKDTLTEDEKFKVDIWSWTDTRLMTEQLKQLERDKRKNHLAVYHIRQNKMVQLGNKTTDVVRLVLGGDGDKALAVSDSSYEKAKTWDTPTGNDVYLVDLNSGEKKLMIKEQKFSCSISTSGNYIVYYRRKEDQWYAMETTGGKTICLTEKITDDFFEDDNGNPSEEDALGIMGWSENDKHVYIYGRYDIWRVDPTEPSKPHCLTRNFGRESKTQLRNVVLDPEKKFIDETMLLLRSFNEQSKRAGFYRIDASSKPQRLAESDHKYVFLGKSKSSNQIIFSRYNFTECPNLWYGDLSFNNTRRLTNANPQQKDYNWASVQLVHWKSPKGRELDGLLYLPEDFDSTKKYPLLVYFYEKYADDIHNYYSPRPSASIINPTEYCSNGYIVFIPDILYNEGSPGEDAYDCIISGTNYIAQRSYINKDRMGLQGQSWGGYQTAYLITQTNMYRAAMAGAPVSNMTSAYGGIRWGSGWSRAFQYEKGQSRLGVSLWEDRERYIKNSPLFHADKVNTPLLIMHNDKDGAVPWYQGIEYFSALRRLDKTVWMLNYNDDDHNLTRRANQKDLSIRMRQFFDHYLLDAPMPLWMKEGLPAIDKGKRTGYELK